MRTLANAPPVTDDLLHRYRDALRLLLPEGEARLHDIAQRFDTALTSLQRQRAGAFLGVLPDASMAVAWRDRDPSDLVNALAPAVRRALTPLCEVDAPPSPRTRTFLLEQLGRYGVVAGRGDALVVNPHAAAALAPFVCPVDAAAWRESGALAAARLVALDAARAVVDASVVAGTHPMALRIAATESLAATASPEAIARSAGELRRAWIEAAFATTAPEPPPSMLADATGGAPWWRHVTWAPLFESDLAVVAACVDCPGLRVAPEVLAGAYAAAGREALDAAPADHPPTLPPLGDGASWRREEALVALRSRAGRVRGPLREALLDARPVSSLSLLSLAGADELASCVEALLGEARDWLDFDAPGEGLLPSRWRDALRLSAAWSSSWAERFEALLEEPTPTVADVLGAAPCPAVAATGHHGVEQGPMAGYSHGLVDGIEEAYGDVHAPADPFSRR